VTSKGKSAGQIPQFLGRNQGISTGNWDAAGGRPVGFHPCETLSWGSKQPRKMKPEKRHSRKTYWGKPNDHDVHESLENDLISWDHTQRERLNQIPARIPPCLRQKERVSLGRAGCDETARNGDIKRGRGERKAAGGMGLKFGRGG